MPQVRPPFLQFFSFTDYSSPSTVATIVITVIAIVPLASQPPLFATRHHCGFSFNHDDFDYLQANDKDDDKEDVDEDDKPINHPNA